ncbi:Bacteroidetes-specific putative membrane protein [Cesiribacter andamanensis AMV16]|uniref:Bacteroidetes-specific putative membrane protein n=2 Tax=Cesiribacter TaxID=1133570 RepID=M7N3Z5_9BACT|nr:Bacteroidetes-specific putative membrane protein [Cesiribacter andamanensis AMV16]
MGAAGSLQAQVHPLYSQYMHDATAINPAYAGSADALTLSLHGRMQWISADGAPTNQILSAHTPLPGSRLVAGLRLQHESVGSGRRMQLSPALGYRLPVGKGHISSGLSANINRYTPGYRNLLIYHDDDAVFALQESQWVVTLGTGLYYESPLMNIGLSVPEILPATRPDQERSIFSRHLRQYVFHAGRAIPLGADVVLKPNVLLSVPERGAAYADANLNVLFRNALWLGASYRSTQQLAGLVQLQLNAQWRLGYSWDMPLREQQGYGSDTHEISLQYSFIFDRSAVRSPRYF